jgi:periplasmic copper chaperone A
MTRTLAGLVLAGALVLPAAAQAHVTVQPATAPAGGFTRMDVRVPNETDNAATTRVELQLPPGFGSAAYEPVPGWTVKVAKTMLAKPIKTDDGKVTEQVSRITWIGHGTRGRIPPGAFQDFGLSVQVPGKAGGTLRFKALQTYSNGKVVRWIGPEGSPNPAPAVKLVGATGTAAGQGPSSTPAPRTATQASDSNGNALTIVALIIGALALLTGAGALLAVRRAPGNRLQAGGTVT